MQALGGQLHLLSGREIFTRMEAVRDRYPADSRRGLDAYIFGFICHYALDSSAHGTVYKGIKETGASHTAIESDFDRALLLEDGFEPAGQPLAGHIVPSVGNAAVISRFFPTITAKEVEKSLSSMRFFHSLLLAPGKGKRGTAGAGAVGRRESGINRRDDRPAGAEPCLRRRHTGAAGKVRGGAAAGDSAHRDGLHSRLAVGRADGAGF